jgi:cyclic pyranopterin phosphate synthase
MPLDAQHSWDRSHMMSRHDLLAALGARFRLSPAGDRGSAPAERFFVDGGPETVGVIASVTAPFCGACDRVRLTADGQVRNCLFARKENDLRGPMRDGATDDELVDLIRLNMWGKAAGHGIGTPNFEQPDRPMSAIGG